ncbi:TusE/DsrC/DsvC family sulfur relay protein [Gemmatimonadota bacterium]
MAEKAFGGHTVDVDDDGFMTDLAQWSRDVATAIAQEEGIAELTDRHWVAIDFAREDSETKGEPPGVRRITKMAGIPTKEMYQLFPGGPGILVARIAGLTKPKGCV